MADASSTTQVVGHSDLSDLSPPATWPARPGVVAHALRHRGWLVLAVVAASIAALGAWGLTADRGTTATTGTEIGRQGGAFTVVDAWTIDDPMSAMTGTEDDNAAQFSQSGMPMAPMSQMMSDAVPEGMKRVAVELAFVAGGRTMTFPPDAVRLRAGGTSYAPYTALLADGALAPRSRLTGVVTFEVPVETASATFHLDAGAPAVAVDVSLGPDGRPVVAHDHTE